MYKLPCNVLICLSMALTLSVACPPAAPPLEVRRKGEPVSASSKPSVEEARAFIEQTEAELKKLWSRHERIKFVQLTYVTHDTETLAAEAEAQTMTFLGEKAREARRFEGLPLPEDLARKVRLLKLAQTLPAPPTADERAELAEIATFLESTYAKGKYCPPKGACLTLDAISRELATVRDYDRLAELWQGWHAIARPMRARYARYVELSNRGARELGYPDLGALWRANYDMSPEEFAAEVERLYAQVQPLYQAMHCYVRKRLRERYGARVPEAGPIPAHLLGNMWAQEWGNIYPLVAPPGQGRGVDLKALLQRKKVNPQQMVRYGEGFFTSLGMMALPETFWMRSMFVRPRDREVLCHASAWDITFSGDVRLKMCIEIDDENFQTVHHELGHIYYYLYYKDQPVLFQAGAHDGFHEAIGDTVALSITPRYLQQIGLLEAVPPSQDGDVGLLLRRALDAVAFLPFGKLIDQWRWDVFSGKIGPQDYNRAWWELRTRYQGIAPPTPRTEEDFDPGAKMHIPGNVPYIRYFLARILQYQFHRALCETAGHRGPLHTCSIHGNQAAGERLKKLLSMGTSRPWPEALEVITGTRQMDATAMLEYYRPLKEWLDKQNQGQKCGW
ncbi:MAG: M2 family metallopeptidase [Myxococcales bacterium]|nr:M2 family metallopeptidase [Myxococcota bacterium]MDW8281461.1 M2 family metallopeptidase [Myxococcales bacterium]